jgi:hypothetical protein
MKKMNKFLLGFILLYTFLNFKCGEYYNATIYNCQNNDVIVNLILEKDALEIYKANPTQPLFELDTEKGLKLISFDTISLKAKILIPAQAGFEIEFGTGVEPTFYLIKEINVIGNDTLVLKNKKELKKAFRKTKDNNGTYELSI